MNIRNDEFMTQNEQQISPMQQQPMNYQNYMMPICPTTATCPFSQMCPIAKGTLSISNYTNESQSEMMSRPYHIQRPNPYHQMQYHNPHFHPHFHPHFQPHFNPFFSPFIFAPWFYGMNYDDNDNDYDNYNDNNY